MAARTLYSYNIYGYDVVYTCTLWNNQWKLCRLSAGYDIWQRQWRKWIEESLFFKIIYCCSEESWKNAFEKMLLLLLLVMMISLLQLQGPRYPPDLLLSLSTSVGQCQKMLNFSWLLYWLWWSEALVLTYYVLSRKLAWLHWVYFDIFT